MPTLKLQSNGPLYCNTVIGTLAVGGWTVTFGTTRRGLWCGTTTASGLWRVCSIYPEYIQHGGSDALRTLHKMVIQVWKEEVVPEEWHQGIIIPLYKGKGSKSECSNYRGITLLSVPGKVFAHIILARIKPTLLSHRRPQQRGFTPGRSTCDHMALLFTLHYIFQRGQSNKYFKDHDGDKKP